MHSHILPHPIKNNIKIKANPAAIKIQHNQDILIALYKFWSRVAINNLNGILGTLAFIPRPPPLHPNKTDIYQTYLYESGSMS